MLPVEFHPAAAIEANDAFHWYDTRSRLAAVRYDAELDQLITRARTSPQLFPPYLAGTRRAVLSGFPYLLVYAELPDRIRVIAVAHTSRRPGLAATVEPPLIGDDACSG